MSAHDPQAPGLLAYGSANLRLWVARCNIFPARAAGRALLGSVIVGPLVATLLEIPDVPPGTGRVTDLAIAAVLVVVLLLVLRWWGQGRGIFFGLWVGFLSYIWFQGLVLAAYTAWLAAGLDGDPMTDWGDVLVCALLSVVVLVPSTLRLRNLDPDY